MTKAEKRVIKAANAMVDVMGWLINEDHRAFFRRRIKFEDAISAYRLTGKKRKGGLG